jgi:hypothetical protein
LLFFIFIFYIYFFFDLSFHNIFHNDILWNIFYDRSTKKIFLWKYFKFIRLLIKIGSWWSIVDHFFVINDRSKKLNTAILNSSKVIAKKKIGLYKLKYFYFFLNKFPLFSFFLSFFNLYFVWNFFQIKLKLK